MAELLKESIIRIKIQSKQNIFIFKVPERYEEDTFLNSLADMISKNPSVIIIDGYLVKDFEFAKLCNKIKLLAAEFDCTFLIKGRADIALAVDADGVLSDNNTLSPHQMRHMLSKNSLIGFLIDNKTDKIPTDTDFNISTSNIDNNIQKAKLI